MDREPDRIEELEQELAEAKRERREREDARYDAKAFERNFLDSETRLHDEKARAEAAEAEVARLNKIIVAKNDLLTAYRTGNSKLADRVLTRLAAGVPAVTEECPYGCASNDNANTPCPACDALAATEDTP